MSMKPAEPIEEQEGSIEEFLRKRAEIEQTIREKFQREITVMFTDIASSTEFYETYGDITGRAMIQRHNDLLGPIFEQHGGKVLRALGDGLMVAFECPADGARAAIAVQSTLAAENRDKKPQEQIWVKAAIHHGSGIVEKDDVYGDMINTLARMCGVARKGDILVSQAYVDLVRDEPDISYDYVGVKNFRGKSIPVDVYRIIWDPAQMEDLKRSTQGDGAYLESFDGNLLLHYTIQGERLRLVVCPNGRQAQAVKQVREFPYREAEIRNTVEDIEQCLLAVDPRGRLPEASLLRLKELGNALRGMLIPDDIDRFIHESQSRHLILQIEDNLVYIPWELLHTGEQFFCIRYSMGRTVFATQQPLAGSRDLNRRPLKMLIIADPKGDLPASKAEGISVQRDLNRSGTSNALSADLHTHDVRSEILKARLADYDLLHYAGHFDYVHEDPSQSGVLLSDGKFEIGRLLGLARGFPLPSLIFTNACQSGRTDRWSTEERLYSLANAFLVAGVRHYIGGTRDLFDRLSAAFAVEFYRQLVTHQTVGEALRLARIQSIRRFGEENLTWASYVLYGDPSFCYFTGDTQSAKPSHGHETGRRKKVLLAAAAALLITVAALVLGHLWSERAHREALARQGFNLIHAGQLTKAEETFRGLEKDSSLYLQGMSMIYLKRGNIELAEQTFARAQQQGAGAPYIGVLKAHLALGRGQLDESQMDYRKVLEGKSLENWQQAECYYGLGKVFLARGELPQAVEAFDRSLQADPTFVQAYTAKGLALERQGRPQDALDLYQKASGINPGDPVNAVLYNKCRATVDSRASAENRARIDQLMAELLKSTREGPAPADSRDEWSSLPLYLFFVNLEPKGQPAPREGEDAYINELISGELVDSTRIHTVEREMIERLLGELKLSSSQLADPQTALRLGRILAARVLVTGSMVRYKGQLQINLRAIDTENTRVMATVSGTCPFSDDPGQLLHGLVAGMQERIVAAYPVRGRISEVEPEGLILNVGSAVGVTKGMKFRLAEVQENGVELTVNEVTEMTSKASVTGAEVELQPCLRVEEVL
jgi:class 3 adenylate cyclase/tetratricopeptide (TPR) repeat protein/CHAT domain-containing protein